MALAAAPQASAQDVCKRTIDLNAANSEYAEQHVLDVGDVAGHQIRIFEIHRTYPEVEANCEGLKQTETRSHGYSDYIDRSGRAWGYNVDTLENGDKIYSQFSGTSHTVINPDGVRKSTYIGTATYTGGTGIYQGIRGTSRATIIFDPEANLNVGKLDLEYWLEN
ncbi:MAG: hypothetical protein HKM95_16415 [Inquilinus sp.]|nr:hypothetical protein [Inquilinus sp.]